MKLFNWDDWANGTDSGASDVRATPTGCYHGVAIGPESHEAYVYANGVLVQAGRWLALRSSQYTLGRVFPKGDTGITSVSRLQVLVAETQAELAVDVRRPNRVRIITSSGTGGSLNVGGVCTSGRRQTLVQIIVNDASASITGYKVVGRNVDFKSANKFEFTLVDTGIAATAQTAFYIGGTNEAEAWGEIDIYATVAAAKAFTVRAESIGELGM